MIVALTLAAAVAAPSWGGLQHTAQTLDRGEVVVRLPTGRSAVGVGPRTEVWVVPFDLTLLGTRIGVEQGLGTERVGWSVSASVAENGSLTRTSVRLDSDVSTHVGRHRVHVWAGADLRLLRQSHLSTDKTRTLSTGRFHVPIGLGYDHEWTNSMARAQVRVAILEEGEPLTYGTASASWLRRWGPFHLELGAGILVGRPREHVFLGRYVHTLVLPYPKVDLWLQF